MTDNDVKIKVSMDGDKVVISGLEGIGQASEEADSKTSKLAGGLKGVGSAFLGFAGATVAAGGALAGAVVNSYASAEQSVGGIETLFKGSADRMKSYAAEAYATAGLSANEYMEQATSMSASLIQSVGGDTAKAAELANTALVAMSDNANKMGTDLTSIQNAFGGFAKGNFTMLDNLKLGYGGTQEEMARLLADAEKLPAAMGQKFDMSNYGDVVTAIQLIQEEMGIAGTTAQEASSTISGSFGMLKGSFDNLLVAMGSANNESLAFLDVGQQAANVVSSLETVIGNVTPVIESLGSSMGTLGPQLGGMMQTIVEAVVAAIPAVLDAGVALIGGLLQGISSALPTLITALVPGVIGLVQSVAAIIPQLVDAGMKAVIALGQGLVQALPSLIPLVAFMVTGIVDGIVTNLPALIEVGLQLIMALVTGIINSIPVLISYLPELVYQIMNTILTGIPLIIETGIQLLTALITALPEIITMIIEVLPQIITSIIDTLLSAIPLIIQAGITLLIALIGALPQIISTIVAALPQIITGIVNALTRSIPQIIMAGVQLLVALVSNMPAILGGIIGAIPQIISGIFNAIVNGVPQMAQAGLNLIRGLWNGISDAAGWLMGKISGFVDNVMGGIKDFFGIKSPSRRMKMEVGVQLPAGIGMGVEDNEDAAIKPLQDMNSRIQREALKLNTHVAFTHDVARPTLVPMQVTPQMPSNLRFQATQQPEAAPVNVTATISERDMDRLAARVQHALINVRSADSRSAALAVNQGVR
jgi:phage-related protein